jgi:hypothetical protein
LAHGLRFSAIVHEAMVAGCLAAAE